MIWHETIRNDLANRRKLISCFLEKVNIVRIRKENLLFIVTPVINVIEFVWDQIHKKISFLNYGSGRFQRPDPIQHIFHDSSVTQWSAFQIQNQHKFLQFHPALHRSLQLLLLLPACYGILLCWAYLSGN